MASYILPVSCLVVAVLAIGSADPPPGDKPLDCPKNEEYYFCYLYRCQRTCDHLKENAPCLPLLPGCYLPGCECIGDYYRNSEGTCVPESECKT